MTTSISVFFKNIVMFLSLGGGISSTIYCFIIPTIMYVVESELPYTNMKNITSIIQCLIISSIGITGGILSVFYN